MSFTYRRDLDRPLTEEEFDGNTDETAARLAALESDPPQAVGISNITVAGTQMTIYLADSTVLGPYTLPQANFRPSIGVDIEGDTDGTFTITSSHINRYLRYDSPLPLTMLLAPDLPADSEVTVRQVGEGPISFPETTDMAVYPMAGFLRQTGGQGSTVTCKVVPAGGAWDLIGRLAEDVTA